MKVGKNANEKNINIIIDGKKIEEVSEFTYLGHVIASNGNDEKAIKERIVLGWAAYSKKKAVLKNKNVSKKVKARIVETYIYPVVAYGLQVDTWNKSRVNKIQVFQNDLMRCILGKRRIDKISIERLKEETGLTSLYEKIKKEKVNLFVKIKEAKDESIAKVSMEGLVEGKRTRGQPKKRWSDDLKEWMQVEKVQDAYHKIKAKHT